MNIASLILVLALLILPLFPCTTREAGLVFVWGQLGYGNGHLNLKRGHSLDSMCSYLAPKLFTKNVENLPSWELNFQNFPGGAFPWTL